MAMGIATGLTIHATLAIGGTAILLEKTVWLRELLRWLAAAYLLWLAIMLVRDGIKRFRQRDESAKPKLRNNKSAYVRGLFCNLLNPKVVVFFVALVTPFLAGERPHWWPAALWLVIVVQAGLLWSLWACVLQWGPVKNFYGKASCWIDMGFALLLIVLAVRLAIS